MNPDGYEVNYKSAYTIIGILIGGVMGYGIGNAIKVPIEIDIIDPEAEGVIKANSLLPSGL